MYNIASRNHFISETTLFTDFSVKYDNKNIYEI